MLFYVRLASPYMASKADLSRPSLRGLNHDNRSPSAIDPAATPTPQGKEKKCISTSEHVSVRGEGSCRRERLQDAAERIIVCHERAHVTGKEG